MLGGKMRAVAQLRIGDLAILQGWLEDQVPSPMDSLPPHDDPGRPAALQSAFRACREWPPKLGTEEGAALLATDAGTVAFVLVCLRRGDPGITLEDAIACARTMTPKEGKALHRIAYGVAPWREAAAELFEAEPPGPPIDWADAFDKLAERFGWGPDQVAALTISQWRTYRTGKSDTYRAKITGPKRQPHPPESA
jgi:hypothetical protein